MDETRSDCIVIPAQPRAPRRGGWGFRGEHRDWKLLFWITRHAHAFSPSIKASRDGRFREDAIYKKCWKSMDEPGLSILGNSRPPWMAVWSLFVFFCLSVNIRQLRYTGASLIRLSCPWDTLEIHWDTLRYTRYTLGIQWRYTGIHQKNTEIHWETPQINYGYTGIHHRYTEIQ